MQVFNNFQELQMGQSQGQSTMSVFNGRLEDSYGQYLDAMDQGDQGAMSRAESAFVSAIEEEYGQFNSKTLAQAGQRVGASPQEFNGKDWVEAASFMKTMPSAR